MAHNITLTWQEPITIIDLEYCKERAYGVYLWGFKIENIFKPYYLGIAEDIIYRIHEHVNNLIGGKYTIFHRESLNKFENYKYSEVPQGLDKGRIYIPNWPYGYKEFLRNRNELQPHINFMLEKFMFSYAEIDKNSVPKQELKDVEKICIKQIGLEKLINTRGGESSKFKIYYSGPKSIIDHFIK